MNHNKELHEQTHFLDTKKVIILSILFAVTIGLIVFSILMLNVDFPKLGNQIVDSYTTHGNLIILLFFALVIYIVFKYVMTIVPTLIRLKKMGVHVSVKDKILFVLSFCFIQAITPGAFITEPYVLFWLKTKGTSTAKATAIIWINEFMWHIASFVMILPSFIIICMSFNGSNGGAQVDGVFILACVGFAVDCLMLVFFIIIGASKHGHYYLSRMFNTLKKWFKLQYHTKAQTEQKYLIDGYLQQQAKEFLSDWKTCILIIFINTVCQIAMFTELFVALQLLNSQQVDYWSTFNVVNVVTTGNKYLPIPGGEGMIQWQLKELLHLLNNDNSAIQDSIGNGIFVWRCSTTYFGAIFGLGTFTMMVVIYTKAIIHKKKIIIKPKE